MASSNRSTKEELIARDMKRLHTLGYAQELFRAMGGFSNFAISFTIISILSGCVTLFYLVPTTTGYSAASIGWPLVTIFVVIVALGMAELASAFPTAGGLYYWASKLGGP
ncbi:MAG: amino acid permease, partial [Chloroflexi bacterium]